MTKHVGGRGLKAPYQTTHVRVPEPIKPDVERLIEQFREGGKVETKNSLTSLDDAISIAKGILLQKKSARVSMSKLLTSIYGQNVTL